MRKKQAKSVAKETTGTKVKEKSLRDRLREDKAEFKQDGIRLKFETESGSHPIFFDDLASEVERVLLSFLKAGSHQILFTLYGRYVEVEQAKSSLYVPKPKITRCKGGDICIEPIYHRRCRRITFTFLSELVQKQQDQNPGATVVIWPYWNKLQLQTV